MDNTTSLREDPSLLNTVEDAFDVEHLKRYSHGGGGGRSHFVDIIQNTDTVARFAAGEASNKKPLITVHIVDAEPTGAALILPYDLTNFAYTGQISDVMDAAKELYRHDEFSLDAEEYIEDILEDR